MITDEQKELIFQILLKNTNYFAQDFEKQKYILLDIFQQLYLANLPSNHLKITIEEIANYLIDNKTMFLKKIEANSHITLNDESLTSITDSQLSNQQISNFSQNTQNLNQKLEEELNNVNVVKNQIHKITPEEGTIFLQTLLKHPTYFTQDDLEKRVICYKVFEQMSAINSTLTIKQIRKYMSRNKDKLLKAVEDKDYDLEFLKPRKHELYTETQKRIISEKLIESNYFNLNNQDKHAIRLDIHQQLTLLEIPLTLNQLKKYMTENKSVLVNEVEDNLPIVSNEKQQSIAQLSEAQENELTKKPHRFTEQEQEIVFKTLLQFPDYYTQSSSRKQKIRNIIFEQMQLAQSTLTKHQIFDYINKRKQKIENIFQTKAIDENQKLITDDNQEISALSQDIDLLTRQLKNALKKTVSINNKPHATTKQEEEIFLQVLLKEPDYFDKTIPEKQQINSIIFEKMQLINSPLNYEQIKSYIRIHKDKITKAIKNELSDIELFRIKKEKITAEQKEIFVQTLKKSNYCGQNRATQKLIRCEIFKQLKLISEPLTNEIIAAHVYYIAKTLKKTEAAIDSSTQATKGTTSAPEQKPATKKIISSESIATSKLELNTAQPKKLQITKKITLEQKNIIFQTVLEYPNYFELDSSNQYKARDILVQKTNLTNIEIKNLIFIHSNKLKQEIQNRLANKIPTIKKARKPQFITEEEKIMLEILSKSSNCLDQKENYKRKTIERNKQKQIPVEIKSETSLSKNTDDTNSLNDNTNGPNKSMYTLQRERLSLEQKQIILQIFLKHSKYFQLGLLEQRRIIEIIIQQTRLTEKRIRSYMNANKESLLHELDLQLTNEIEQIFNNSKQNDTRTFIKK